MNRWNKGIYKPLHHPKRKTKIVLGGGCYISKRFPKHNLFLIEITEHVQKTKFYAMRPQNKKLTVHKCGQYPHNKLNCTNEGAKQQKENTQDKCNSRHKKKITSKIVQFLTFCIYSLK